MSFRFFDNPEAAFDHARVICRDLTRDAYVVEVKYKFLACRDSRKAKNKGTDMTDCLTNDMDLQGIPTQHRQPFTVIMIMPDDMRADEACAADWIRRVWVYGLSTDLGIASMIADAREQLSEMFGWNDPEWRNNPTYIEQRKEALEPVAIFPGHHFDIYRPLD